MKQVHGIWFPEDDVHFAKMMNEDGTYQRDIFRAAMEQIKTPKIFFDIGAHVGLWSRMAIMEGFDEILAFEPNPKTFECLVQNMKGYELVVSCYNYGVTNARDARMYLVEEKAGNSGAVFLNEEGGGPLAAATNINDKFALHDFIFSMGIKKHECLVKIDTEGMEAKCVEGMDKILYALRPVVVVEQRTNRDALALLQQMGMQITRTVRKDHILTWRDQ